MSDPSYILGDFVDRDQHIALMWQMQRREIETRVLVIEGRSGIGKSHLLAEFKAQCQEESIQVVHLDFEERYEDPGYMHVVKRIWVGLGPDGFDPLARLIRETQEQSIAGHIPGGFHTMGAAGSGGGVDIHAGSNTFHDVAGRDINNFFVSFQREDPFVQEQARVQVTSTLKECLEDIATRRRVLFLLDHWQKGDSDTRRWVAQSLVHWLADHALPQACMVISDVSVPDLDPRRCIQKTRLAELDDHAAQTYLVEKHGLSPADVPKIMEVAGGLPLMLLMAAERWKK